MLQARDSPMWFLVGSVSYLVAGTSPTFNMREQQQIEGNNSGTCPFSSN